MLQAERVRLPHALLLAVCCGTAFANVARLPTVAAIAVVAPLGLKRRVAAGAFALFLLGWCWGSARLERLDRSVLVTQVGRAERAVVVVTAPARRGRFDLKLPVDVQRFGLV